MEMNNQNYKTPKEIRRSVLLRWIFTSSVSSNYEKMQALAYCYAIFPFLKHKYTNPEELKKATLRHLQFFNTNPWIAPYIFGLNLAVEEDQGNSADDTISSIKSGLMGALAGVGDSMFVVIPWTIFGAIAANMAIEGSPVGIFLWIIVSVLVKLLSFPLYNAGYFSGTQLIDSLESKMRELTEGTSILGLMVVGGLIPSVIRATVPFEFRQGELTLSGQDILNQIMPGLIPLIIVGLSYYLLSKKVSPTKLIMIIILLSIVLSFLNILG